MASIYFGAKIIERHIRILGPKDSKDGPVSIDPKDIGEIAKKHKLSPRHVGKICSQNNIVLFIPCHRVIRSDGSMGGFSSNGGIALKKKLLNFEKNFFKKN